MINIRTKKMRDNAKLPKSHNGNWADCYNSVIGCVVPEALENGKEFTFDDTDWYPDGLTYTKGDVIVVKLGFCMELPKGKEAYLMSRSGTFRKTGLILTNSVGLIDDSYCGDSDEWMGIFYATREGHIDIGDRLLQMRIQDAMPKCTFEEVETLNNKDRGSYGSTGK